MNGYDFTERVRHTLARAREHAIELNHEYLGTEHILLALLESDGVGATVLQNMEVDRARAAELVMSMVKPGGGAPRGGRGLPYASRSKKVLELSMSEARTMNHSYVGTEHLLLGLLGEGQGIAAQVLRQLDVHLEDARRQLLAIVGGPGPAEVTLVEGSPRRVGQAPAPPPDEVPTAIDVTLRYSNGAVVKRSFTNRRDTARFLDAI